MAEFAELRRRMVSRQIEERGIRDPAVLRAFAAVPREEFVAPEHASLAYGDHPLPIAAGQTISQPYIVALMIDAAEIQPGDHVLEVGAGSGYAACVIGQVAARVTAIERHPELARAARERAKRLGYGNVRIIEGDGTIGSPEDAPFGAILAAASGRDVPRTLLDQLAEGGRLVMPLGAPGAIQQLVKIVKEPGGGTIREELGAVRFVPLIGVGGWSDAGY